MSLSPGGPDLASLSSLDDPVRRRLYEVVASGPGPVSRDEAASAAGIGRALAVYHLDKLVESGLLTASYSRPPGRRGPGAGRPAKLYARSDREFAVTVPPREYELAARLLVQAVEADPSDRSRVALAEAARRLGTELGSAFRPSPVGRDARARLDAAADPDAAAGLNTGVGMDTGVGMEAAAGRDAASGLDTGAGRDADAGRDTGERDVTGVLTQQGYEPCGGADGVIRLRNCPFHQLTEQHREVVCGMNLALVEGLLEGLGADGLQPVLDPRPGHCCVAIGGERA